VGSRGIGSGKRSPLKLKACWQSCAGFSLNISCFSIVLSCSHIVSRRNVAVLADDCKGAWPDCLPGTASGDRHTTDCGKRHQKATQHPLLKRRRCYYYYLVLLLGRIALAVQVIPPIPTHFSIAWSVCLSHSCTLLKPFDGFRCHLAGTFVGSSDTMS